MKINTITTLSEVRTFLGLSDEQILLEGANMEQINAHLVKEASPSAPAFMLESHDSDNGLYRVIEARYKFDGHKVVALFDIDFSSPESENDDWKEYAE